MGTGFSEGREAEYVPFFQAGDSVKGEFHCAECRYGVTICRKLPRCPMCGGLAWEQMAWSPFGVADPPREAPAGLR